MNTDEYIKIFKEILVLTEEIEILCKEKKFDNIEKPFNKRDELFNKLDVLPNDITREKYNIICEIKDKITEKNNFILKCFKVHKSDLKMELSLLKKEEKVVDAYKITPTDNSSSIFDIKE